MKAETMNRRAHPPGATFSTWNARDGWPIRRMNWPQPEGSRVRGSLLFAGGRGDFIEKYLEPLGHWHDRGWNVSTFDWRSQGQSQGDVEGGHLDSFEPLVSDGSDLIADWMEHTPGPHVAVGHSMGGHLLLRIVSEARPPLAAAVLVAPMIGINSVPMPAGISQAIAQTFCMIGWNEVPAWKQSRKPPPAGSVRQSFLTSCSERYSDELWWLERQPEFALGAPSWGWLNAAYASMAMLTPERLSEVELPIFILGTERDRLVSASAIRTAAAALPGAQLMMLPDAAHEILRESDVVRVPAMEQIDAFFGEHARR